jgi:putative FmdB family regulatory protein
LPLVPLYEYRCPNGHLVEVFHGMNDPSPDRCEVCGASPLERVLHPVAVHYKGSGFYSTDYGRGGKKAASKDGSGGGSGGESSGGDSSGGDSSGGSGGSGGDGAGGSSSAKPSSSGGTSES